MGTGIRQQESKFTVRKENLDKLMNALKAFRANKNPDNQEEAFYRVSNAALLRANTLTELLEAWRWHPSFDEGGNISDMLFTGEKDGDDHEFFRAFAGLVERGSFIDMAVEHGTCWRWLFDGVFVVKSHRAQMLDEPKFDAVLVGLQSSYGTETRRSSSTQPSRSNTPKSGKPQGSY